jgi:hypothetical protein
MRRLRLKLSHEGKELAEIKHRELSHQITKRHYDRIQQLEGGQRSGATKAAIDREHFDMARELAEGWIEAYLDEYVREDLIPDDGEVSEMGFKIEEIVKSCSGSQLYTPLASSAEAFRILPMQIYKRLQDRVRRMQLESKRVKPAAPPSGPIHYTTNIQGPNYGGIQQGGQSNTQSVSSTSTSPVAAEDSPRATEKESKKPEDEEAGNKLYDQVLSLSKTWEAVDEAKAQLIVEYAKDAIELFGKTNQDKKVELRRLSDRAEQIISPDSIDTFRKRSEKFFLRLVYPKSPRLRNAVLAIAGLAIVLSFTIPLLRNIQLPETTPPAKQKIAVILPDVTISLTQEENKKVASLTADILDNLPDETRYAVFPIQAEPVRVLPIIPSDIIRNISGPFGEIRRKERRAALEREITGYYQRARNGQLRKSCIINLLSFAKDQLDEMSKAQGVDPTRTEYELFILSDMEENCEDSPIGEVILDRGIREAIQRSSYTWMSPPPNLSNVRITVIFPLVPTSSEEFRRRPKDSQLKEFWRNVLANCGLKQEWFWDNEHITWISNGALPSRLSK